MATLNRGHAAVLLLALCTPCVLADLCSEHTDYYFTNVELGTDWALAMYDSSSKLPDGLWMRNVPQLGNFDECINARSVEFIGQYCRLSLNVTRSNGSEVGHADWAVCAPSTCNHTGVAVVAERTMNALLRPMNLHAKAKTYRETCYYLNHPTTDLGVGFWITMFIVTCIILVVVLATAMQGIENSQVDILKGFQIHNKHRRKVLYSFSLHKNMTELWSLKVPASGNLGCLNGMRVLSLAWVIIGHRYAMDYGVPIVNFNLAYEKFRYNWKMMPITNAFLCVDSFFFLGGLLTSYVMLKEISKGQVLNPLKYYVYRYLRLTPALLMLVILVQNTMYYISNGPLWSWQVGSWVQSCSYNWWATILYVNNYVDVYHMCINHSWYLSIDMQLSFIAPLAILALVRWPRPTLAFLAVTTLGLCFWTFAVTYKGGYPWTLPFTYLEGVNHNFTYDIYIKTEHRAAPYIIGFLFGYAMTQMMGKEIHLKKIWVCLGWAVSVLGGLAIIYTAAISYSRGYEYNPVDAAFYGGFHRAAWAVCLSWVVFACVFGYGGPVNRFLSWPGWLPFTRLSYCGYLTHYPLMYIMNGMARNGDAYTNFRTIHHFFSDVFTAIMMATVLYLTIEAPTNNLLKMAFKKERVTQAQKASLLVEAEDKKHQN